MKKKKYLLLLILLICCFGFNKLVFARSVSCTYGTNISITVGLDEKGNFITKKNDAYQVSYNFNSVSTGAFISDNGDYYCPGKISYKVSTDATSRGNVYIFSFVSNDNYPMTLTLSDSNIDNTITSQGKKIDHTCSYGPSGKYIINYYTDGTISSADSRYRIYDDIPTTGSCLEEVYICRGELICRTSHWQDNNCTKIERFTGSYVQTDPNPQEKPTYEPDSIDYRNLCSTDKGVQNIVRFTGIVILLCRFIAPIIIIILGIIDLTKAVTASDDKAISKAGKALVRRFIAGFAVFIAPSLIKVAIIGVDKVINKGNTSTVNACTKCVFEPFECNK